MKTAVEFFRDIIWKETGYDAPLLDWKATALYEHDYSTAVMGSTTKFRTRFRKKPKPDRWVRLLAFGHMKNIELAYRYLFKSKPGSIGLPIKDMWLGYSADKFNTNYHYVVILKL